MYSKCLNMDYMRSERAAPLLFAIKHAHSGTHVTHNWWCGDAMMSIVGNSQELPGRSSEHSNSEYSLFMSFVQ